MSEEAHVCTQDNTIKELIKFQGATVQSLEDINKNISGTKTEITSIKTNHLEHIYKELQAITLKMATSRPSWTVSWIITTLTSLSLGLLIYFLTSK